MNLILCRNAMVFIHKESIMLYPAHNCSFIDSMAMPLELNHECTQTPAVPLSARSLLHLIQVQGMLGNAGGRASCPPPVPLTAALAGALQILADGEFREASAALHPRGGTRPGPAEARTLRRNLFAGLRTRYPEAMALLRTRKAPAAESASPIFMVNLITGPTPGLAIDALDQLAEAERDS
jgi:hypothetical protein